MLAVLGRLGAFVGGPGPSWVRSSVLCWRSWSALGAIFAVLGLMLAVLGCSWRLCWRSWRLLGPLLAVLGRLGLEKVEEHDYLENVLISRAGALLGPMLAVLGRSWSLCWRSWVALRAYVRDLGALLAVLGRS